MAAKLWKKHGKDPCNHAAFNAALSSPGSISSASFTCCLDLLSRWAKEETTSFPGLSLFSSLSLSTGKGRREAWKRGSILTWRLRGVLSSQPVWWLRTGFLGNSSEFNTLKRRIKRLVLPPPQKYHVLYRTEYQVALREALVLPYIKQKNDKVYSLPDNMVIFSHGKRTTARERKVNSD